MDQLLIGLALTAFVVAEVTNLMAGHSERPDRRAEWSCAHFDYLLAVV